MVYAARTLLQGSCYCRTSGGETVRSLQISFGERMARWQCDFSYACFDALTRVRLAPCRMGGPLCLRALATAVVPPSPPSRWCHRLDCSSTKAAAPSRTAGNYFAFAATVGSVVALFVAIVIVVVAEHLGKAGAFDRPFLSIAG